MFLFLVICIEAYFINSPHYLINFKCLTGNCTGDKQTVTEYCVNFVHLLYKNNTTPNMYSTGIQKNLILLYKLIKITNHYFGNLNKNIKNKL